ncbi:MAG: ATP synthase F0 subunit B [Bdellovibrionaceae bacterium]|nr:ATP synthase F0 subunit B [Bdellovibrionales bacterium]MCB9085467.1 ATP synthase F0 subunit B [Pseudobdellovibrionaceae bacterium]
MEILTALGVDSTLGIQFIIFIVAYIFLTTLVFKPYHRAYEERVRRTEGNTDLAERILTESKDLEVQFEQKARALNNETKIIYDHSRSEAMKEYDRMVSQARERAKSIMEKTRLQIAHEFENARSEMNKEIPGITKSVVQKMMGQEV